jgi:hypothetical protein
MINFIAFTTQGYGVGGTDKLKKADGRKRIADRKIIFLLYALCSLRFADLGERWKRKKRSSKVNQRSSSTSITSTAAIVL